MKKFIIGCGLSAMLLSACTPANPPQALNENQQSGQRVTGQEISYGMLGPGPINYHVINHRPFAQHEGEINHSASFRTPTTTRQDLGDDQDKIREIVELEGFTPGMIITAGSHAWVNVRDDGTYQGKVKEKKMRELQTALKQGIPRYQIHLNTRQ
ncbi:hypothetical protein BTR23_03295 [Alkalihalophilus pseudofirmus]|uniref:hypothetical protein n=1 Tax=Alkalihalobacterium alkalinitrilicum TaxID=427920 RepID=UPI00094D0CA3|nr:hypothetical protein [Alkalihalobacterium alkalinitrilicum]OLO42263.1 hypothetical protein BTR23_03295 [Alkalihalophilus pseudofirmus]